MDAAFMDRLEALRMEFGRPINVSSGYRSPEYNAKVSTTGLTGPHTTGRAVDILISGEDAIALIAMAIRLGFTGFGVSQHGPHRGRFVHLHDLAAPGGRKLWSYA